MIDAIIGFGSFLFDALYTARATISVVNFGRKIWEKFKVSQSINVNTSNQAGKEAEKIQVEIVDLDKEVEELERKFRHDKYVSNRDQEKRNELIHIKNAKFKNFENLKSQEAALKTIETPNLFETVNIDHSKSHIIEYHMGVAVLDKKCPECSRGMVLRTGGKGVDLNSIRSLNDFFWGCTGFFCTPQCRHRESLRTEDLSLLQQNDCLEMQISNRDLKIIVEEPLVQKNTIKRIQEIQYSANNSDKEILCPMHYTPMILRKKKEPSGGFLDAYHLRCTHEGCNQINKLKSPAQLAAFLKRKTGRGIL